MAANTNNDYLIKLIKEHLDIEIEKQYKEAIEFATKRANEKIKEKLAEISLKILSHYSVERDGSNLIITVRNELK